MARPGMSCRRRASPNSASTSPGSSTRDPAAHGARVHSSKANGARSVVTTESAALQARSLPGRRRGGPKPHARVATPPNLRSAAARDVNTEARGAIGFVALPRIPRSSVSVSPMPPPPWPVAGAVDGSGRRGATTFESLRTTSLHICELEAISNGRTVCTRPADQTRHLRDGKSGRSPVPSYGSGRGTRCRPRQGAERCEALPTTAACRVQEARPAQGRPRRTRGFPARPQKRGFARAFPVWDKSSLR